MSEDYATMRVVSWTGEDETIHDDCLRADKAMGIARKVWTAGEYDRVGVVNERTGATRDTISRTAAGGET